MSKINRVAETVIRTVISAGSNYQEEVLSAVNKYKYEMSQIQKTADSRYAVKTRTSSDFAVQKNLDREKEEETRVMDRLKKEYIQEKQSALAAATREQIRKAQDSFQVTARESAKSLRNQLEDAILSPINVGFLRLAETMQTFNVAPSRLELDALLTLAEGNLTAVRCIDSLLKKTDAAFTLEYKSPDDYVRDLDLIEKLGTDDFFCSPLDAHHEMNQIFKGQKINRDEDSASNKRGETFDSIPLLMHGQSFVSAMEKLESMIPSWGADIHYEAADALSKEIEDEEKALAEAEQREPDLKDYDSNITVQEDNESIKVAKEIGKQAAAANKSVTEVLGNMVR